jgi:hypothetical protein
MDAMIALYEQRHLDDTVLGIVLGARLEFSINAIQSTAVPVQVRCGAIVVTPNQNQQGAVIDAVFDTAFEVAIELGVFSFQVARNGTRLPPPEIHICPGLF